MAAAKLRVGALASGGGTNLQAIIDAITDGSLDAEIRLVISNNSRSGALKRARAAGIPTAHLSAATHPDPDALDSAIADALANRGVDLIALAGYMKKLGPRTLARFPNRIVNVHPSLLPKYGGRGMYGERVHAAVLAAGERETGVTVHIANGEYDSGMILVQERVPVLEGDTPSTLAARVLEREHVIYPQTLQRIALGEIVLPQDARSDACQAAGGAERESRATNSFYPVIPAKAGIQTIAAKPAM